MSSNFSSVNDSVVNPYEFCYFARPFSTLVLSYIVTFFFLLFPLCVLVLGIGLQRWWRHHSSSSLAETMSHCDCFTYHLMVMELLATVGWILDGYAIYFKDLYITDLSLYPTIFSMYGEMCFHDLTCAERYLAVVYPITYRSLSGEHGLQIRNVILAGVWILCLAAMSLASKIPFHILFCLAMASLTFISFCSLSVLCVLIGPRPGEPGGDTERVHRTKRQAFYIITASLVVLLLRFGLYAATGIVMLGGSNDCLLWVCQLWFGLPTSLMIPILFLLRARQEWQKKSKK